MGQRSHAAEQVLEENTGVRRKSDVKKFIVRLKVDNKQTNGECVPGQTDFPLFRLLLITKGSLFTGLNRCMSCQTQPIIFQVLIRNNSVSVQQLLRNEGVSILGMSAFT